MFTSQDSSLAGNLQFSLVDSSLQGLTLSQMTTQHNLTVPRRKNPLQVRLTARISPLRHSTNWSLRWIFPLVDAFNLHTSSLFLNLHSTTLCTHSYRFPFPPNQLFWQPFWGCRLQSTSRSSAGWSGLPRSYPGAIRVHTGWYSGLFPRLHFLRRSLSGRRLAPKPDVAGALRSQHNPASQCLRRSSVSRIGDAAAREAASCEQSFFGKRSTDGAIVCEAAERTIHVQHVKETRSQTRSSQTGITLQCIAYCNKEHSHQSTCSLYTGGNLADTGSLELPPWNPPASWSLPWALHVPSDHDAAAKLAHS